MIKNIIPIGILVTIIGFIIIFIGALLSAQALEQKTNVKFSFFGLIGPIPFGLGNDKRLFLLSVMATIIFVVLFFMLNRGIK
jgi:uncharacterized protein (TIGR00304 family)